jgi:hypothetical protein
MNIQAKTPGRCIRVIYANVYCNPGSGEPEKMDEASKVLRQQASQLEARTHAIPWY